MFLTFHAVLKDMDTVIRLPEHGADGNVSDFIVSILSNKGTRTLKELHLDIIHGYRKKVSYQSVHKACNLLAKNGIVAKDRTGCSIRAEWIDQLDSFVQNARMKIRGNESNFQLPSAPSNQNSE